MIRLYCIGIFILIIAILANAIIQKIGVLSWYEFIKLLSDSGKDSLSQIGTIDYLWLFIGYPFVLSLGYVIGDKLYSVLFT